MRAGLYVGRVGGLAVALGIGAAVLYASGTAFAESGTPDGSSASETASASQTSSARSGRGLSARPNSAKVARAPKQEARPSVPDVRHDIETPDAAPSVVDHAAPAAAAPGGPFGNTINTDPDVTWVDGIFRGTLGATSTTGLPLTYTVVSAPSLGGKITFSEINPQGQFTYLPYMTTLTNAAQDEQFAIMVAETTAFNTLLSNIPILGLFATPLLNFLHRVPIVNDLLSPIIGSSKIVEFDENPFALADGRPSSYTYMMPSFDGTLISVNYFPAENVASGEVENAPTVLVGPGLAKPAYTNPDEIIGDTSGRSPSIAPLRSDQVGDYDGGGGYNVFTWDPRGQFASGGVLQLDSPFWEGRDASSIISFAVSSSNPAQDQLRMEAEGDPYLGMVGSSYGGALGLVVAGTPDHRVDAIVPTIAWNSLLDSMYPNGAFKTTINSLLLLSLVATGARINSQIYQGILQGVTLGRLSPSSQALLADSGPTILVNNITVPTLFIQGTDDPLFTLNQTSVSAEQITSTSPEVPVKVSWFRGGHAADSLAAGTAGQDEWILSNNLRWLDQYVAESGTPADSIPNFEWADQTGTRQSSALLPFQPGFNNADPLAYEGDGGKLVLVPVIGGSGPAPQYGFPFSLAHGAAAGNALNVSVAPPVGTVIAGSPTVSFTYRGIGSSRFVYAQLVDNATGFVVGGQVAAVPVTLDGQEHTVEFSMEDIAYTAYDSSDTMTLQITSSAVLYENFLSFGLVDISDIQLDLPTVAG